MKRFAALALTLSICLLASCMALSDMAASGAATASPAPATPASVPTPVLTSAPSRTPAPTPTPRPTVGYDTDIPDVTTVDDDPVVNSGRDLYEDEECIYMLSPWYYEAADSYIAHTDLYRIDKADGSASLIAQDCGCFTMSGGKIYYAAGEAGEYEMLFNTVDCYNTATGMTTQVFHGNDNLYCIAVYDDRIYYSADPHPELEYEFYSDLFSRNLDGSDRKLVVEEPYNFCIYDNSIYYTSGGYGDGTPVFRCDLDGSNVNQIVEWLNLAWYFEICSGSLIFSSYIDEHNTTTGLTMQSLETGEQTIFPGYDDFTLMGQYVVASGETLDGIDIRNGRIYRLAGLDNIPFGILHSGEGCAYISAEAEDGSFTLYRLTIENGSAVINMVARAGGET